MPNRTIKPATHSAQIHPASLAAIRRLQPAHNFVRHPVFVWASYLLVGFWLRLVVAVGLIGCGMALQISLPLALWQVYGFLPDGVVSLEPFLHTSDTTMLLVSGIASGSGTVLLALAFGPLRRWLLRHPGHMQADRT
jgi:hypothetical protein